MDNYRILTFGGAGASISNVLLMSLFDQDKLFFFDTDVTSINSCLLKNKFQIGINTTYGRGTNAQHAIAETAFAEDKDLVDTLLKPDTLYILVGGFGGGVFTTFAKRISEILHKQNKKFIILSTLPFTFEEESKTHNSLAAIKELNHYTDKLILLQNDLLHKYFGDLTVEETFRKIDYMLVEVLKELIHGLNNVEIVHKNSIALTPNLEDIILQVKGFMRESEFPIATSSSKIIVAETNKDLLRALTVDPAYVYKISPRKFEELVEYIYKLGGYKTELTKASRDDGADVLVWTPPPVLGNKFLTVVQAKRYAKKNKVGSAEIRELIGTSIHFNADKAQMVTTSDYSKPAIQTAKSKKIDLLKFYELNETILRLINVNPEKNKNTLTDYLSDKKDEYSRLPRQQPE